MRSFRQGHGSAGSSGLCDALRAGAALLVLLSHVRDFTLRDAAAQPALSWVGRAIFAVCGLGHQAVIVFFVLSGYLVTGSMLRLDATGRWSLGAFATARLTRLWVVLVPCLMLGALLDNVGIALASTQEAAIHYGVLALTLPAAPPDFGVRTLLGNLVFLQTIAVPVFGSNGALWSLANEAWYYAVAALLFAAWHRRGTPARSLPFLGGAVAILVWLPWNIGSLAPVWASGAFVALATSAKADPRRPRVQGPASVVVFAAVLIVSRLRWGPSLLALDYALAAATACLMYSGSKSLVSRRWASATRGLSRMSYSLYLSHSPVLAVITAVSIDRGGLVFGTGPAVFMGVEAGLALLVAAAIWWCFERHTDTLRAWLPQHAYRLRPSTLVSAAPNRGGSTL